MYTGDRGRIQAGLDELGNWSGKSWIKFSERMGSLNNQLQGAILLILQKRILRLLCLPR